MNKYDFIADLLEKEKCLKIIQTNKPLTFNSKCDIMRLYKL